MSEQRPQGQEHQHDQAGYTRPEYDEDYSLPVNRERDEDGFALTPPAPRPSQEPPSYRQLPRERGFSLTALLEAAVMVGLSLLLALAGLKLPLASLIGLLLYPLPLAILTFRRGLLWGLGGTAALCALSVPLFGLPQAVLMLLQYGVLGVFLGWAFRSGRKPLFILSLTAVIAALGAAISFLLSYSFSGLPLTALSEQIQAVADAYLTMMRQNPALMQTLSQYGWTEEQFAQLMSATMLKVWPAALIVSSALMGALCYAIFAFALRRFKYQAARLPKFRDWRLNWRFAWGVILGLILLLLGDKQDIAWAITAGASILYVFAPLLLICGLAFYFWYMNLLRLSPFMQGLFILVVLLLFSYLAWFLMLLAVLDDLLDLRGKLTRWRQRREERQ